MIRTEGLTVAIAAALLFSCADARGENKSREITVATISVATLEGAVESNYDRAYRLCEIALHSKPDLIVLPEAFAAGYGTVDLRPYAESPESPHLRKFQDLSRRGSCIIVLGYLEKVANGVKNAVVVFDSGEVIGRHYKRTLWKDDARPYRDEQTLMLPGDGMEVFTTRLGRFAVIICYENVVPENWEAVAGKVDFIVSPYNCEHDPAEENIGKSKRFGIPSIWADRTGTVFAGGQKYAPNLGSAGFVDAEGNVIARSRAGIEEIVIGKLHLNHPVGRRPSPFIYGGVNAGMDKTEIFKKPSAHKKSRKMDPME